MLTTPTSILLLLLLLLLLTLTSALTLSEPFKPPDNHHHQHVLSTTTTTTTNNNNNSNSNNNNNNQNNNQNPPPILGFISLGDSYSAGIGTRPDLPSPSPPCRQGLGAYPHLLASSLKHTTSHQHQWLSCTGATTNDILSSPPPPPLHLPNRRLQPHLPNLCNPVHIRQRPRLLLPPQRMHLPLLRPLFPFLVRLRPKNGLLHPPQRSKTPVALILLEMLNKIPWERHPSFFITVTGYARFFNENTTACDDVSFGIWDVSHTAAAAKLTRDIRGKMNDLVLKANDLIRGVIEEVNASFSGSGKRKKVVFVDHDSLFDGHRFCEPGVAKEPDYDRRETWFFLPGGGDVDGEGRVYTSLRKENEEGVGYYYLDPERCWEEAAERGDWGEKAVCLMAKAKREDPGLRLRVHYRRGIEKGEGVWKGWTTTTTTTTTTKKPGDSMWLTPTYYGKTFHPRSAGHEAIRDKIFQVWEEHGYLKDQTDL
ncbi:LOW QUALITY PROTEIN: hypothetical protein QC761_708025 [Podospora bellae-mahoneyi]|uniref:Uncharacterized protein n=1 Tax=Podospora bellae-mahoneyi TaxID=2093777 RepID=A0ABR0F6W7_9PEZI|nr:LOW QUALITY PROTEIN: hypothetical protein QC761_708025 [Podospora bellae-mahoneyi]